MCYKEAILLAVGKKEGQLTMVEGDEAARRAEGQYGRRRYLPALLVLFALWLTASHAATGVTGQAAVQVPRGHFSPGGSNRVWFDPAGKPLPYTTEDEVLDFMRTARVVQIDEIEEGVSEPRKVLLEKDGIRLHAIFRDVNYDGRGRTTILADGSKVIGFRDSYLFEVAAYELSRLLGLDNVPPTVLRTIGGDHGSLQLWIEGSMSDSVRLKQRKNPPDGTRWSRQMYVMKVFDELIYNTDRNLGNILSDRDWKLWMVDHTRAFRSSHELMSPEQIFRCERNLWENLQKLDEGVAKNRLKKYLGPEEIRGLLKRREKLVSYIRGLIEKYGENQILYAFH